MPPKPKLPVAKEHTDTKTNSPPAKESNSNVSSSKFPADEQTTKLVIDEKSTSVSKEDLTKVTSSSPTLLDSTIVDGCSPSLARVAAVPTNLQLESTATSTSNCTAKEVSKSTPVTSPRAASKIPTPLPRKTIATKCSPSSSTSSLSPPTSPSSPKTPTLKARTSNIKSPMSFPQFPKASEIPIPVGSNVSPSSSIPVSPSSSLDHSPLAFSAKQHPTSPTSNTKHQVTVGEETLPAERRRTVVEICEKVVVPQGKTPTTPPVTPFITVDRVNEKQSSATEVRIDQQSSSPSRKS
ncbi:putative protein TPRXL [Ceratina calcarata]|uniref:Uncharacterized protein n=1 Tax=Ceratina calcarata TaxID=156304 RepID=A0AAJ7RWV5_9HYME|nr:putative protein TPRXL [Ceratina calcarata]